MSKIISQSLKSRALQYTLTDGYSIIPVGLDKRPLLASWKEYQMRLPTEKEIENWWKKWPNANIGIVTGKISGIIVIDIDTYKKDHIDIEKFPTTFTVLTGNKGYHLFYNYVEGFTISANAYKDLPGVDIRSDGGYVVAVPSVTSYLKDGASSGGEYTVFRNENIQTFPLSLFPKIRTKRTLKETVKVQSGSRNDSLASVIGQLLQAERDENKWASEVMPAILHINQTYSPPLSLQEVESTFSSIVKKEKLRRENLILSPIQMEGEDGEMIPIKVRKNRAGVPYKDMANVLLVLSTHPYYKHSIRYNEFRQEIEYKGKALEEHDLVKIQYFMQTDAHLPSISKDAVYAAIQHYAAGKSYDEAKDWLTALTWDGVERLKSWVPRARGVTDDKYHQGIGSQWFMGIIRRIMNPGCIFDYMLVLVGAQGIGKTSFFRIVGGPWYKSYTGAMDNKDFYLALRGAVIVDLDEGAAMYKSEAIKIKSIITETHDEFRAPYDRIMKKFPRRFVFSMSTNDTEPFRDVTGNRRYWTIDAKNVVDFKWLEENRDQLYAEAYHYFKEGKDPASIPMDEVLEHQEAHLPSDSWADLVRNYVQRSEAYCKGDILVYSTTTADVYSGIFPQESLSKLGRSIEMRLATILRKECGLVKARKLVDGERKTFWELSVEKARMLKEHPLEWNQF